MSHLLWTDTKSLPLSGVVSSSDVSLLQSNLGQTPSVMIPAAVPAAPTVIVKQPEPVRPYTGATSYKTYREYFQRICSCNRWTNPTECARYLFVAVDGAASETVRGIMAEKDSDLNQIWEALSRRFGFVDEPERAMRRFDDRKQQEGESLAVFEQGLRVLYREDWPKTDIRSSEADSLLRRKFVDGIADVELQKYLCLHAASDDFAATVSKARHFVDASEMSRIHKKPAIRATWPSVNYQTIFDGVRDALANVLHDQGRIAEVSVVQEPNLNTNDGSRNRRVTSRQGSPAPSNMSAGNSSHASSTGRTVRFQDPNQLGDQGYESLGRSRWPGNQPPLQRNNNGFRPWGDRRQQQRTRDLPTSVLFLGIWTDASSRESAFSSPGPEKLGTGVAILFWRSR